VVVPVLTASDADPAFARVAEMTALGNTLVALAAGVLELRVADGRTVNDQEPPVTAAPFAVAVTAYVLPRCSAAVGVNVTTPVVALKLDVPATADPPDVIVIAPDDAFASVAVIGAAGSTPVAFAAGVFAVSDGLGADVVNDHVPPVTAAPFAVAVTAYVVPGCRAAVGLKVTTPVAALKLDVPATADPPDVTVIAPADAFASVAEITADVGSTFVAEAAGLFAVSVGADPGASKVTSASTKYDVAFHDDVGKPPPEP